MNKTAMHFIELALREKIKLECPGYGEKVTNEVVETSLFNNAAGVSRKVLIRAIELAAEKEAK